MKKEDKLLHHHILPNKVGLRILLALLILTITTVIASRINFGAFNFPIAMLIATIKALMVVLFFMGLKYDNNENRTIFVSSFAFVAVFFALTSADLLTRHNRVDGPVYLEAKNGESKFKDPWIATDELKAHGKELFQQNCVICHGAEGHGDGPASVALNPKPRNFTQDKDWKNGRHPSQVFGTLTKGLNAMPSFATLSTDDRWSLAQYILSLGPTPPVDTPEDLKKIGIDPSKGAAAIAVKKTIPIDYAITRYVDGK